MGFSKKKKKGLHFHSMSDSPIFVPKSYCSLKKKKRSSLPFDVGLPILAKTDRFLKFGVKKANLATL